MRPDTYRLNLWLMMALTFSTGVVDAVGYLGLDRVFTGNMTGNVVILGMALTGADELPVAGPTLALVGFMAGAALGGRVLRTSGPGWTHRATSLLALVGVIVLALAVVVLAHDDHPPQPVALTVTALLGAAMGVQAATARFIAVKDVTTVVVTSTITGLAADSILGAAKPGHTSRRFWAVLLIGAGAAVGALLLRWHLGAGLALTGLICLGVAIIGAVAHPRVASV